MVFLTEEGCFFFYIFFQALFSLFENGRRSVPVLQGKLSRENRGVYWWVWKRKRIRKLSFNYLIRWRKSKLVCLFYSLQISPSILLPPIKHYRYRWSYLRYQHALHNSCVTNSRIFGYVKGLLEDASANQDSAVHSTSDYQNRRHRRFLVIFVTTMGLVGVAVAIVLASVYGNVAFTEAKPSARQQEGFTLDEVLSGKFYAESFNGTWISGSLTNLRSYKLHICLLESFFSCRSRIWLQNCTVRHQHLWRQNFNGDGDGETRNCGKVLENVTQFVGASYSRLCFFRQAQLGAVTYKFSYDRKYVLYGFDIKSVLLLLF